MALGMPSGGGGSGGGGGGSFGGGGGQPAPFGPKPPGYFGSQQTMSPQQQSALNWLQGASGQNLSAYNSNLSGLNAQRNAASGAYGSAAGAANRDYGLSIRGINQDLMYGNQLRGQEQYRNVDLGRARSNTDLGNAEAIWRITQQDLGARTGFARRGFGLGNQQVTAQYDTGMRGTASDAIARGARSAAGTLAQFGDVRTNRDHGLQRNRLDFDTASQGINNERRRGGQSVSYARQTHGIDMKTFDSIAKTYGIQAAQAVAQASLGRDRAGANRDSSVSSAAASRNQQLAGLGSAQSSAYNNYTQQQMALMQQMYGLS